MKYLLFIACMIFLSCSDSDNFVHKPMVRKNTTIAFTVNYLTNQHIITNVEKDVKDTFSFVTIDSTIQERKWKRDSFYYFIHIDTLKNATTGLPEVDSVSGRLVFTKKRILIKKEHILVDYNKEWAIE